MTASTRVPAMFVVVAVSVAVGALVANAPAGLTVGVILGLVLLLGLTVMRVALAPSPRLLATGAEAGSSALVTDYDSFKAARVCFYGGAATLGLLTVRPGFGLTASDLLFLMAFGITSLGVALAGLRVDYFVPRSITFGVLIFAVGGLVSSMGAVAPSASAAIVVRLLYLTLAWFWLASIVLRTHVHVERAVLAWVASAAAASGGAVIQYFLGDVIPGGDLGYGRVTGFTPNYNSLGGLTAIALVPALAIALDARSRGTRFIGLGLFSLTALGLLLSGSVGGLTSACCGFLLWLAVRGATLRLVISLGLVAISAVALMSATGSIDAPSPLTRISKVSSPGLADSGLGGTVFTRLEGYGEAWQRISEQPFVGVGLDDASSIAVLGPKLVHNMLIIAWFSAGILGLIGIVVLLLGSFACGIGVMRGSALSERPLNAALIAAFGAFVVDGMGEPLMYVRYGWFPTALLIALRAQQTRGSAAVVRSVGFDVRGAATQSPAS